MLSLALYSVLAAPLQPDEVDFLKDVYPLFEARCIECHGPDKQKGRLRLDDRVGLFGEEPGAGVVVPGDPDDSILLELVSLPADDPDVMPAEGDPLKPEELELLRRWIEEGATFAEPAREVEPEPLALPTLSPEAIERRDAALAALGERGVHPMIVAQGLEALDVNLSLHRDKAGDADAALLAGLEPVLVWANFSGTALTDAGLASLGRCGELRRLNLSKTGITDAGLAHLKGLGELTYLNLYGTAVTDAGLGHLAGLTKLKKLYLWQTAVTDEGVQRLATAVPGLEINRGATLALVEETDVPEPVNTACPITGKDVNKAVTSEFEEKVIAFCCADCKAQFDKDPASFKEKIVELVAAVPVNEKCPVSDKPVDPGFTSDVDGKLVAFCCGNCKGKFDADPTPFLEKLGLKK